MTGAPDFAVELLVLRLEHDGHAAASQLLLQLVLVLQRLADDAGLVFLRGLRGHRRRGAGLAAHATGKRGEILPANPAMDQRPQARALGDGVERAHVCGRSRAHHGEQRLDSAFALGREEVSVASSLMQSKLLQRNFVGMEDTSAFKAIQEMRSHLD